MDRNASPWARVEPTVESERPRGPHPNTLGAAARGRWAGYAVWAASMAAGQDTFIHSVMAHWGIGNATGAHASSDRSTLKKTSRRCTWCRRLASASELSLQGEAPSPILAHPETKCMLVDGEAFSWYGSRMAHVADHLRDVAHWVAKANGREARVASGCQTCLSGRTCHKSMRP